MEDHLRDGRAVSGEPVPVQKPIPFQKEEPLPRPRAVTPASLGGPARGEVLCSLADLADCDAHTLRFGTRWEDKAILIRAHEGGAVAYLNDCPHFHIPLDTQPGRFLNHTGERFLCANHYARFRFEDGYCDGGVCEGHWLVPVAIEVRDGKVLAG